MTELDLLSSRVCQNCGNKLIGEFCAQCGQKDREVKRPLTALLKELLHAVFELDGRAYRSLYYLFCKPAYLSREYVEGRRASYTPPLRLFLVLSILLFFIISTNSFIDNLDDSLSGEAALAAEQAEDSLVEPEATDGVSISGVEDADLTQISEFIDNLEILFLSPETNANLVAFIRAQATTNYERIREDPEDFLFSSLDYITVFLLIMMPLLALVLKALYFFSKRYYLEHMILTLHNHTFFILAMMIQILLDMIQEHRVAAVSVSADIAADLLSIWMILYLFLSLKNYYGQGYLVTTLKFTTATLTYSVLLLMGLAVFMGIIFILF